MGINYKIIEKKIRLARKYRGMSQEEFAEKTFSNQNQISLLGLKKPNKCLKSGWGWVSNSGRIFFFV